MCCDIAFILCSRNASDDAGCSSYDAWHAACHAWNAPRVRPCGPLWIITFPKPALKFPTRQTGGKNTCKIIAKQFFCPAFMQHDANGWDDASHDAWNAWITTW